MGKSTPIDFLKYEVLRAIQQKGPMRLSQLCVVVSGRKSEAEVKKALSSLRKSGEVRTNGRSAHWFATGQLTEYLNNLKHEREVRWVGAESRALAETLKSYFV